MHLQPSSDPNLHLYVAESANEHCKGMVLRGGGAKYIEVRPLHPKLPEDVAMIIVHVIIGRESHHTSIWQRLSSPRARFRFRFTRSIQVSGSGSGSGSGGEHKPFALVLTLTLVSNADTGDAMGANVCNAVAEGMKLGLG